MAKLPRKEKYRRKYANKVNKWWTEERKQAYIQEQKYWCKNMGVDWLNRVANYIEANFKDEALVKTLRKTAEAIDTGNDELYLGVLDWGLTSHSPWYIEATSVIVANAYIKV